VNFLAIDRTDILAGLRQYALQIPNHVVREIDREDQSARLRVALTRGDFGEFEITDLTEIALYAEFRRFLGDGESACLAVAASRRWMIATDEKRRLRREILDRLGEAYLLNTPGAILETIRAGIITVAEAEEVRHLLAQHRFAMADVPPFDELLRRGN